MEMKYTIMSMMISPSLNATEQLEHRKGALGSGRKLDMMGITYPYNQLHGYDICLNID